MSMGLGGGKGVVDSFGEDRVRTTIGFVSLGLDGDHWTAYQGWRYRTLFGRRVVMEWCLLKYTCWW